mmetsp:Transcript_98305/g.275231  ORF Transcript_98305/g.275231 Transcript_98305/m.275231 type:complete len:360 (-) Transcript_98305:128-1207(-)
MQPPPVRGGLQVGVLVRLDGLPVRLLGAEAHPGPRLLRPRRRQRHLRPRGRLRDAGVLPPHVPQELRVERLGRLDGLLEGVRHRHALPHEKQDAGGRVRRPGLHRPPPGGLRVQRGALRRGLRLERVVRLRLRRLLWRGRADAEPHRGGGASGERRRVRRRELRDRGVQRAAVPRGLPLGQLGGLGRVLQDLPRGVQEPHPGRARGEPRRRRGVQAGGRRSVHELQRERPVPHRLLLERLVRLDAVLGLLRRGRPHPRAVLHPGAAWRAALRRHRRLPARGLRRARRRRRLPHGAAAPQAAPRRLRADGGRRPRHLAPGGGGERRAALRGLLRLCDAVAGEHGAEEAHVLAEERHRRRH